MLAQGGKRLFLLCHPVRRLCASAKGSDPLGLFETSREETDRKEIKKQRRTLALRGTLDAELHRIGVHLGQKGDKYVSSHDIDRTGKAFYPESISEGFPHLRQTLKSEQMAKLAELLQPAEAKDGIPSIFRWEVQYVLTKGDYEHPKNKAVKMRVFLRELQEKYELSDEAIQHVIKIVDHRYDPETGLMTLASQKYPRREDNRREIMRIVEDLVKEGRSKFPKAKVRLSYTERRYPKKPKSKVAEELEAVRREIGDFFSAVDADGDGNVSLTDWKAFFDRSQVAVEDSALKELMLFADEDEDGTLNLEEFTKLIHAVSLPDAVRDSVPEYRVKNRALTFPFTTPDS